MPYIRMHQRSTLETMVASGGVAAVLAAICASAVSAGSLIIRVFIVVGRGQVNVIAACLAIDISIIYIRMCVIQLLHYGHQKANEAAY